MKASWRWIFYRDSPRKITPRLRRQPHAYDVTPLRAFRLRNRIQILAFLHSLIPWPAPCSGSHIKGSDAMSKKVADIIVETLEECGREALLRCRGRYPQSDRARASLLAAIEWI